VNRIILYTTLQRDIKQFECNNEEIAGQKRIALYLEYKCFTKKGDHFPLTK